MSSNGCINSQYIRKITYFHVFVPGWYSGWGREARGSREIVKRVLCRGNIVCESTDNLDDILVKYVIGSCVLCVDNNKTKSIEKVLLVKVWLTKNMSSN